MKNVYRIIDANINRAMEGLRVIEEIARFHLEDPGFTRTIKDFRARFKAATSRIPKEKLLAARASLSDVGGKLYTAPESKRSKIEEIFYANIKRSEESMRVLEEFSKLIDPAFGRYFKTIRFDLYEIEKRMGRKLLLDFGLYVITDPSRNPIKTIREAGKAGVRIVQLRDKSSNKTAFIRTAQKARQVTRKLGMRLIINDHIDIAKKIGADGVHIGSEDQDIKYARKALGSGKIIGVSASTPSEARRAERDGADYIGFGPVFRSAIKPSVKPLGINKLAKIVKSVNIPVVALGGINNSNIDQVIKYTGQVAVISAVLGERDMKKAALRLIESIGEDGVD